MSNKYDSPFSPNEIRYFMSLMQEDAALGRGSTYAKLEVLLDKMTGERNVVKSLNFS